FICHGSLEDGQAQLLLTRGEGDGPARRKTDEVDFCNAARLLELLRLKKPPRRLPCIVILNACHTADAEIGLRACQSIASSLVAGGVPVVLGMAGEVADGACRLYTRGFYEALLGETNVAQAAGAARRLAMRHYRNFNESVEWARLTLFARVGHSLNFQFTTL